MLQHVVQIIEYLVLTCLNTLGKHVKNAWFHDSNMVQVYFYCL